MYLQLNIQASFYHRTSRTFEVHNTTTRAMLLAAGVAKRY